MSQKRAVIILAAGQGKRMRSEHPKILHPVGGRAMIDWSLALAYELNPEHVVVVTNGDLEIESHLSNQQEVISVQQTIPKGTGDAVRHAIEQMKFFEGQIIVLFADTPLVCKETVEQLFKLVEKGNVIGLLAFETSHPFGYGRIIHDQENKIRQIIEEKDTNSEQKRITLCNSGLMCFESHFLYENITQLEAKNSQKEYYLTDLVKIADQKSYRAGFYLADQEEVAGVNTQADLALMETSFQKRKRAELFRSGVMLIAPETVYFSYDTQIEKGVKIEPYVVFGPGVKIGCNTVIKSFSHIEGANIGINNIIGPYARLRPGSVLDTEVKIGNFVEIKNANIDQQTKINHLSYIGDALIGKNVNIGAGTITCNYDGKKKHQTRIEENVFVGSNTALIAPVSLHEESYIASGSVITFDVPKHALAFGRARQINKKGGALKFCKLSHFKKDTD